MIILFLTFDKMFQILVNFFGQKHLALLTVFIVYPSLAFLFPPFLAEGA